MSKKVRKYTKEFKGEALKLALNSESVSRTAQDLGIPEATLHSWVKKAKNEGEKSYELSNGEKGTVNIGDVLSENQALRKRLIRLEQEKDILKKAAAYFARESMCFQQPICRQSDGHTAFTGEALDEHTTQQCGPTT